MVRWCSFRGRPLLVRSTAVASILLMLPAAALPATPSSSGCLEALSKKAKRESSLTLLLRGGDRIEGKLIKVTGSSLVLETYDPSVSRFGRHTFNEEAIGSVVYTRRELNGKIPVLSGLLLGTLGFLAGQSIHGDPDWGTAGSRSFAAAALPVFGLTLGVVAGLAVANATGSTVTETFTCEP